VDRLVQCRDQVANRLAADEHERAFWGTDPPPPPAGQVVVPLDWVLGKTATDQ
jgi:hypothetical protein